MAHYQVLDHTADLRLRLHGADPGEIYALAARALFEQLVDGIDELAPEAQRGLTVAAPDHGERLVEWLNELLYLLEVHGEVHAWPGSVALDGEQLTCQSGYLLLARCRGRLQGEVKSATYHQLRFEQEAQGWVAEVTLDL